VRAVVIEAFGRPPVLRDVAEPDCDPHGVILTVGVTGLCRSDWHAWQGHDPDVRLPHVPGHEIAGTVAVLGSAVRTVSVGDRVTVPFVCACGTCQECLSGHGQTCLAQQQPGFTYWGSFAERVAVPNADVNLVGLPVELDFVSAAALGCRLATAYRALHEVAEVAAGETLVVFGCGGVGLAAITIARSIGARVIAVDPSPHALELAQQQGAQHAVPFCNDPAELVARIRALAGSPADVTMDAIGSADVLTVALRLLRPRGCHVQVGLLPGSAPVVLGPLIGGELRILGSHGMAAPGYRAMLADIAAGAIRPAELVRRQISLEEVPDALAEMGAGSGPAGITVIVP
jgi:alcohol dehydrogenase